MENLYLNNKAHCKYCQRLHHDKWKCMAIDETCTTICTCPLNTFDNNKDWFPVLIPYGDREYGKVKYFVPFAMIKEHEQQCLINHGQTANRLKERGGLSWDEMWAVVHDIHWDKGFRSIEDARVPMIEFAEKWNEPKDTPVPEEKEFIIPVEWSMCGFVKVKATSAEEAIKRIADDNSDISVPSDERSYYIEDSFAVSAYESTDECVSMVNVYTEDYERGKEFNTLN